jgi:hypothetical protein
MLDFNARMYDPQIGRTFQVDPLAEWAPSKSPYSFLANNPINFIDPSGMYSAPADDLEGGGGGGSDDPGSSEGFIGSTSASNPNGWFIHGGGYSNTSLKWMGLVRDNGTWYYKNKEVSEGYAKLLVSFGRTTIYDPKTEYEEHTTGSGFRDKEATNGYGVEITLRHKDKKDWTDNANTSIGAFGIGWGAKENLINYASKFSPAIEEMKYVKGVKIVTKAAFVAQIVVSGVQATSAWANSDRDWTTNDGNKWGVTGKATLDITMGAIATFGGPVGWAISGTYFIADAAGLFDSWSRPEPSHKH